MPKVSVIMGVYNTPKDYIDNAICSILEQTFKDFEFIICNDGCTDDTYTYIKEKYKEIDKIVWIENHKNRGLAFTLNHCLELAKGEYIARMDTDDYSLPNRLENQVKVLEENQDIGLVNCNINVFDENGIWGERKYNEFITKQDFIKSNPIVHPAVMARKIAFTQVNNYRDIKMTIRNEDYDLFMRMFANNVKMYTIQEKQFNFREDKTTFKRRKYKYRINEFKVRFYGYKILNVKFYEYIYAIKPLIVGLLPSIIIQKIKKNSKEKK